MSALTVSIIAIILLIVLVFLRIWVGLAMSAIGFFGLVYLAGWHKAFAVLGTDPFSTIANYTFTTVPMFVLMGLLVSHTGIGADLYSAARLWVGQMRGGLAVASVIVCGVFAAICGNSTASAVTIGKVAYPEMKKNNYDDRLSAGCIAAGGTIGILIPPSVGFILYGLITENSIGKLFMAGIIPGILQVVFYVVTVIIIARINPRLGPIAPREEVSFKRKLAAGKDTWPVMILIILVLGGIYGGIFTATEAGAIGAFGTIILTLLNRKLTWAKFRDALADTAQNTAMIVFMITGAFIFMRFLAVSGAPAIITSTISGLVVSKWVILAGIVILYLILGCFLDILAAILLTLPIIYPVVVAAGFDPIWFGVILVRLMEIGLISPPFGLNCFVLSKAVNVPVGTTFRGVVPFLVADILHLGLLIAVPQLSLFLTR